MVQKVGELGPSGPIGVYAYAYDFHSSPVVLFVPLLSKHLVVT